MAIAAKLLTALGFYLLWLSAKDDKPERPKRKNKSDAHDNPAKKAHGRRTCP